MAWIQALMASEQAFWKTFCEGVGRPELFERWPGSRLADHAKGNLELRAILAELFAERSTQAWIEFDVDSVENATAALESSGYRMLVKNKKEPWGQIVSRFISPEGLLVGITFTPSMRKQK